MSGAEERADDGFTSITWDQPPNSHHAPAGIFTNNERPPLPESVPSSVDRAEARPGAMEGASREGEHTMPSWGGKWMAIEVREPTKEHEGSKEMHVSYAVRTRTNLAGFPTTPVTVRRRFQDFVFLRDHLTRLFPACVVPPIPDKHRLEYIKGDRFSIDFIEHRRSDLQHFVDRLARHPTLQRSQIVNDFLQSTQWSVAMNKHLSTPSPDGRPTLLDNISDSLVNAFTKVRKPDERFLEMREAIDKYEEAMNSIDRLVGKERSRTEDLAQDYVDLAASYQGLGYLESGITEPLNRFAEKMLDYSTLLKELDAKTVEPFLSHCHLLVQYSQTHKSVIKLRDQKQLDFEELSAYLSAVVAERDRLAALNTGHTAAPVGISTFLRDKVDQLRGTDDIHTRRERIRKMDIKIKELQDAVTGAHETSTEFSEEIIKEHNIFELSKQAEMKTMMGAYADGQIEMYEKAIEDWDRVIPLLSKIKVDI
ncbi:intercellular trafficking and secretion [Naganishia adeliensis]|uniref:Intercellular trafficking and secretion n=1 Tax=Naganishia adeliensis TaxID=92952 RepID=A0ACC2WTJ7_9TREE|nr:intercellular trafficking and secretion [Naganishia adeliensis]